MDLDDTTIQEDSFEYDDRDILYATAGKEGGRPVVVFYPLGSSRRCLSLVEDEALERGLWLICCNRPGHGTSRPQPCRTPLQLHGNLTQQWRM